MKKKRKKYFDELSEKYRDGAIPECTHFGVCGGCMFQDISYGNQLLLKKEYINDIMKDLWQVESIHASDSLAYRNRMDFVCAFGKTGLRERGSFKFVADISSCPLLQNRSGDIYKKLKPVLGEIEGYDYLKHNGYLRYVVFRQAKFTGQVMVNFVVAKKENRLKPAIDAVINDAHSISLLHHGGLADLNFGEIFSVVKNGSIEERFENIKYTVTPNSFFQSNSSAALEMYRAIRSSVKGSVLDLYSGVGSISLFVAGAAESVTGVETVAEAVDTAIGNREINGIENADFIMADAAEYIAQNEKKFNTLILDPPRSGLHPKMIKHINALAPERIIYMSCNPVAFRDEVVQFENYKMTSFEAHDMFPQTPHIETLAVLERK